MISYFKVLCITKSNREKILRHLKAVINNSSAQNDLIYRFEHKLIWELSLVTSDKNAKNVIDIAKEGDFSLLHLIINELERFA